ncbi:hypothetical protein HU200_051036 [Digitaria exilis]|uniref:Uncharacterized protein n=1 Tax=Digitaria exilis TaxID=1010633 RepID=A0A835AQQ2_9POAL|nr:hypothetical protein HU200_051036 [Digitaria exilis]
MKLLRSCCSSGYGEFCLQAIVTTTPTPWWTCWGQEALRRGEAEELFGNDVTPRCAREFEEDVLMWHIATCIYLSRARVRKLSKSSSAPDVPGRQAPAHAAGPCPPQPAQRDPHGVET